MNAQFYSPMGLRGDHLVTLFFLLPLFFWTGTDYAAATSKKVIINEILYRPDDTVNRRFIEILNPGDRPVDIRNWQVSRSLGPPLTLQEQTNGDPLVLAPGSKAVISEPGLQIDHNDMLHYESEQFPSLSRLGDAVFLRTPSGETVDSVFYYPEWGGNRDGVSLERIDPEGASLDPANWKEHPSGHSAGRRNHHYLMQPELPEATHAVYHGNDTIKVVFNRFVTSSSLNHVYLEGRPLSSGPAPDRSGSVNNAGTWFFRTNLAIERSYMELELYGLRDVAGRENPSHTLPLSFQPRRGELIINEVMYQPITDRYSLHSDQSDYVEIYNRSGIALQLDGVHLHDRPDKYGRVQALHSINLENSTLHPGSYALFYPDTSLTFQETRIYKAFTLPETVKNHAYRIDRLTLGLSTRGDEIYLATGDGTVLDSLWYMPSWHNPSLADTRGISLERIHPDGETMSSDNWTSNTLPEGGTPGYQNSVAVAPVSSPTSGLLLHPNPFSPDGDAYEDHLVIEYQLDDTEYLLQVQVFDRTGRRIRTLADGIRAGRSGRLIWDGRTDNGILNRPGLYIIRFEAADIATGRSRVYREIAVLARSW